MFNRWNLLLFSGLFAILFGSCEQGRETGVPGGQAAVRIAGEGPPPIREPIEVLIDGKPYREFRWAELSVLQEDQFQTGLQDTQTGYLLIDVLEFLEIPPAQSVTLYGLGLKPVTLHWDEIRSRDNQILLGLTHKGTAKVISGNPSILNRDGWVRHLTRIHINKDQPSPSVDGRKSEPAVNPQHPRKKSGRKQ